MSIAEQLKHRIEQENWQPITITNDDYQLDLPEVHGKDEVGFVVWRKRGPEDLELLASGHTLRGRLVDGEEQPLDLSDDVEDAITTLLDQ